MLVLPYLPDRVLVVLVLVLGASLADGDGDGNGDSDSTCTCYVYAQEVLAEASRIEVTPWRIYASRQSTVLYPVWSVAWLCWSYSLTGSV